MPLSTLAAAPVTPDENAEPVTRPAFGRAAHPVPPPLPASPGGASGGMRSRMHKPGDTTAQVDPGARSEFDSVWSSLEAELGLRLRAPREVVWLNGAPGSGKGANTAFILKTRGISNKPVEISGSLQEDAGARALMEQGLLISDKQVLQILLRALLDPAARRTGDGAGSPAPLHCNAHLLAPGGAEGDSSVAGALGPSSSAPTGADKASGVDGSLRAPGAAVTAALASAVEAANAGAATAGPMDGLLSSDCQSFLVDGFPRTRRQVDYIKLLFDKLDSLHRTHVGTPREKLAPKPFFQFVVLWVTEEESIRRQLIRGLAAHQARTRSLETGLGHEQAEQDLRATDMTQDAACKRYTTFRANYGALLRLKEYFPFRLIDGMGTLAESQHQIAREMRYQSSLELSASTYALIRDLPLASDLTQQARHQLVVRLDRHAASHRSLFEAVIKFIRDQVVPALWRTALAGRAEFETAEPLFEREPAASEILVDVLTDRGYQVVYHRRARERIARVDLTTGAVVMEALPTLNCFSVRFTPAAVRDATVTATTTAQTGRFAATDAFGPVYSQTLSKLTGTSPVADEDNNDKDPEPGMYDDKLVWD